MDPRPRIYDRVSCGLIWIIVAMSLWACAPTSLGAEDDRIWSALVLARNVPQPREPIPELRPYSGKIKKFFGYNQVELVGSATKTMTAECERWLVPSQNFWLGVKSTEANAGGYRLEIELFQDKRRLITAKLQLAPGSPLIIRGPLHARGQLLIVLQIM